MPPEEIRKMRQWTYSYSSDELKRPTYTKYEPNGAITYDIALKRAGVDKYIGFYPTKQDPYILIDLDHINDVNLPYGDIPLGISSFLQKFPTYTEITPSGEGLRFIYQLPTHKDKAELEGSYFKNSEEFEREDQEAQVNIAHPWQTITSNQSAISINRITEVTIKDLAKIFKLRYANAELNASPATPVDAGKLDSLSEVTSALFSLPIGGVVNPRLKRAYRKTFGTSYSHYDYWVKVMMAMHNYGELSGKGIQCLDAILQWSEQDAESYAGEDDVAKHWRSFKEHESQISYKTLFKLANTNKLKWPVPRKQTKDEEKHNMPLKPLITEYVNFKAMVDYYDIKLYREESNPNILYITADPDIISNYFMMYGVEIHYDRFYGPYQEKTIIPAFYMMCQKLGFVGMNQNQARQFVGALLAESKHMVSFVKYYFDTPILKLPLKYQENIENWDISTPEYMFECLDVECLTSNEHLEKELYKAYYKKWLMGMARNLYFKSNLHMNNCILILTGKEQVRKTSHFQYLLPSFFKHLASLTPHGFKDAGELRDVMKISATSLIVFWDEIEEHIDNKTEANFKKVIDANSQKVIDKYEVIEKTITPMAIYGGSSNQRTFKLGNEGTRRIFHIPVKWVDTDKLSKVCWHRLINDLKKEIQNSKDGAPWLLTEDQLRYQSELHERIKSKNNLELALEEIFDFETPWEEEIKGGKWGNISSFQHEKARLMNTKQVIDILIDHGVYSTDIKRTNLIRTLERACGAYTGTQRTKRLLRVPNCAIYKGLAVQSKYKRWVMPHKRTTENAFVDII